MKKLQFGKAFPDQFKKASTKYNHFKRPKVGDSSWQDSLISNQTTADTPLLSPWRRLTFFIVVIIIFTGLFMRLFHLQVIEGKDSRELADSNRIKVKTIHAPRGVIYDRNGRILSQNEPGFRLVENVGGATKVTYLERDAVLKMEVVGDPAFKDLEIDNLRAYPMREKMAHILGYVGEISADELKSAQFQNYSQGDKIGRGGTEQVYEKVLRGMDGGEVYEVDAQGEKIRSLRKIEAIPGQNIYLSIDANLQGLAYQKLTEAVKKSGSCCGALVASDPNSGEILTLVSYPSFDPSNLTSALQDPNSPLLNRVISGTYPPGSTFKIVTALAGLSSGRINPQTQFEDSGVLNLGTFSFANWYFTEYGKKEGWVDIIKAIQRSNDIFFYHVGQLVGEKALGAVAKRLGLGGKLGIDIPGEAEGLIPDEGWKVKNFGVVWYPGDTLHMAIGQGFVLATPLQINNLISTIALDGKQYPPHLALKITSPTGHRIKEFKFDGSKKEFKEEDLSLVKTGLEEVPKNGGTAWPFFNFPIPTSGKTGTAEFGDPKNRTHAWYTSYAPANNPKIALTVLVEGGGEGSNVSAPIAKEIYRWYFSADKNNLIKDLGAVATDSAKTLGE